MRELSKEELQIVGGGKISQQSGYDTAMNVSIGLVAGAITLAAVGALPFVAGALALGSLVSSATGMYYAMADDPKEVSH